jgi:hypothetical protein
MANLNKTECGCMGIYNASTSSCDTPADGVDPCPSFWNTLAGWDWNAISGATLTWGYALGIFQAPPVDNSATLQYQAEIERQKRTMTMLIIGFLIVITILIIYVVRSNKKK